ncbi:MAG TPA: hypothetical protein V6C65_10235 [Allocoleopsis sp.]
MATPYDDVLVGTVYDDYLNGEDGADFLVGDLGSDILVGGNGNDSLIGYGGNFYEYDNLNGGYGADYFYLGTAQFGNYYLGAGYAVIEDFYWQEGDKIAVSGDSSQYSLEKGLNFVGSAALDTAIYKDGDLLAVIQDTTNVIASQDFIVG